MPNDLLAWRGPGSPARFHYENVHMDAPTELAAVSIGLVYFAGDVKPIRRLVDRDHKNVVSWHEYAVDGRHPAHHAPDVLIADLCGCSGSLLANHRDAWAERGLTGRRHMLTGNSPHRAWRWRRGGCRDDMTGKVERFVHG